MDSQIGESAACATALLCGVKANQETLGLDQNGVYNKCASAFPAQLTCLIEWAQVAGKHFLQQVISLYLIFDIGIGKATGLATTTRVTHATTAAAYAKSASRYWEDDEKLPSDTRPACKDIARQLVEDEPGRNINVSLNIYSNRPLI